MVKKRIKKKSEMVSSWQLVFPNESNHLGTMFGGKVIAEMDIIGSIAAAKFAETSVVTASAEAIDFRVPVLVGDKMLFQAIVVYTGKTSMVVRVDVYTEKPTSKKQTHCTTGYFNMVAMGKNKKPCQVSELILETKEEIRENKQAALIKKYALQRLAYYKKDKSYPDLDFEK